jgi:pyrimidine-specific ribonucleoside hydrolase
VNTLQTTPDEKRPLIVDTDLSVDDYVALLYLLQRPEVEIRAITVVNGVVHVKPGVENLCRLLAWLGRDEIPVAGGAAEPLTGERGVPPGWRLPLDYGPRILLPRRGSAPSALSAPELLREQILASEAPVTLLALGPLTNLALLLREDPALAGRIEAIVISGGAIQVPGTIHKDSPRNPNTVAEWNLYVDATAADIVFRSGAPLVLIPLDVTHVDGEQPLLFSREFVRRLRQVAQGKASRLLVDCLRLARLMGGPHPATPVWDGVAAALTIQPEIGAEWRELGIHIETEPDEVAGQTAVDDSQAKRVRVCLRGDQEAFESAYLATLAAGRGETFVGEGPSE